MSYKNKVISDLPVGYWRLNEYSSLTYDDIYAFYNEANILYNAESEDRLFDETVYSNKAMADAIYQPILAGTTPIVSSSSSESNVNGCRINDNSIIHIQNLYNAFHLDYERKPFGIEFWVKIDKPSTSSLEIIGLSNDNGQKHMSIYALEDQVFFDIYQSDGSILSCSQQVVSWSQPIHVFAVVNDREASVYINGIPGLSKTINSPLGFLDQNISTFNIGPAPTGRYYYISDLAFYDKLVSAAQIYSHIALASRDSDPIRYSNQTDNSHFTFNKNSSSIFSKQFSSNSTFQMGTFSKCIQDKTGITVDTATQEPTTGTWTYPISLTSYSNFSYADISWDSGSYDDVDPEVNYVNVSISYDNGSNFYTIKNGKSIPYFSSNFQSSFSLQLLVKVTINSIDTTKIIQPRLDNLSINIYSSIGEYSDSGLFNILPLGNNMYITKSDSSNILSRSNNLGINFSSQAEGALPGTAVIYSRHDATYQAIEFWFRYDGAGSAILDTNSLSDTDLYVDTVSSVIESSLASGTVYVNGVNVTSNPPNILVGEVYHVVINYPSDLSNPILINGSYSGLKDPCEASYGYLTVYPSVLTQSEIRNRYLSYLSSINATASASSATVLATINEYSGSSAQINSGQPIISHRHAY